MDPAEAVALYAAGWFPMDDEDAAELPWYAAFAAFKLAVVCAGIVARVRGGAMLGEGFDGIEERIGPLVEIGRTTLAERSI